MTWLVVNVSLEYCCQTYCSLTKVTSKSRTMLYNFRELQGESSVVFLSRRGGGGKLTRKMLNWLARDRSRLHLLVSNAGESYIKGLVHFLQA